MKKIILRIGSLLLVCACIMSVCCSCGYASQNRIGAAMWVVEDKDGNRVYLFGTIHIGTGDMYPFCDEIEDAFDSCDYLAVEYDTIAAEEALKAMTPEQQAAYYLPLMYTDGSKVSDHLSSEAYGKAVAYLKQKNVYSEELDYYTAAYWDMLISNYLMADAGFGNTQGVDEYLLKSAKADGKNIIGVESEQSQLAVIASAADCVSDEDIKSMLGSSLSANAIAAQYRYMLNVYDRGDMETMAMMVCPTVDEKRYDEKTAEAMKEYNKAMLTDRNANMAEAVKTYLSEGKRVFFAVGCAHMLGDDGIVALLKTEGYLVYRK